MDLSLTEAEGDLVELCREFATKEIAPRAPAAWEAAECPTDLLREMGRLGLPGMLIPEEWGGIDISAVRLVAAVEKRGLAGEGQESGFASFVVEKDTPGFTMGPKMRGIGWRGLDTRELYFDDVWVPDDQLLGDPSMGLSQFLRTLEVGRISIAALSLSLTQAVLDLATEYATQRVQFGQAISKFQAVQFKLADIATELEAARWLTYRAASLRDAGRPFLKEASMAKLKASRVAAWAASEAVQIHGGTGYMLDTPVARFYCDAKVIEIGEGTNEMQHLVIARTLGC